MFEPNRPLQVPAIQREARAGFPSSELRQAHQGSRKHLGKPPREVKVILAPRAVDAGLPLAIDPDYLIALVPTTPLVFKDGESNAHDLSVSPRFQNDVVTFPGSVQPARVLVGFFKVVSIKVPLVPALAGRALAILSMEVGRGRWE